MRTRVGAAIFVALALLAWAIGSSVLAAAALGGGLILLAVAIVVRRRGSRGGRSRRADDGRGADDGRPDENVASGPSTTDLAARASHSLVQADDAVLTSEQELGFAIAVFGERAMAPFSAAVEVARAELREAFSLRQLIDDTAASDALTRSRLTKISAHCGAASQLLDDQAAAFDRAQHMHDRAPQLVAEVDAHIAQQSARLSQSRQVLDRLAAKYTPEAVAAVAANPDHAATRLEFAANSLASAEHAIAAGDTGKAAVALQAAEAGADQATDQLTGVLHMEAELTQAASAVPAALREIEAEIADAGGHLTNTLDEERSSLVADAQAVSDGVRDKLAAGAFDALVALRDMQQADAALDRALAGLRTGQARRHRAIALLDEAMLVARSSLTAAEDFITTRRGSIGPSARTRLSEARRHYGLAIASAQPEPENALTDAQHADALALQARSFAEHDVAEFQNGNLTAHAVMAADATQADVGLRGAILGGILIDDRAGGVGPGSFGGVGTRGRDTVGHPEYSITGHGDVTGQRAVSGTA